MGEVNLATIKIFVADAVNREEISYFRRDRDVTPFLRFCAKQVKCESRGTPRRMFYDIS